MRVGGRRGWEVAEMAAGWARVVYYQDVLCDHEHGVMIMVGEESRDLG